MAAKRKAVAHLKPGTTATHTPTGQHVTVAWESNGPRGRKGPWYWCRFPVAILGVTQTTSDGYHMATVHGSTLNYAGMKRNPFDGNRRTAMPVVPGPVMFKGYRIVPLHSGEWSITAGGKHIGYAKSVDDAKQTIADYLPASPNPPLVVFGNPPGKKSRGSEMLSKRAISIRYVHAADGQRYEHKFGTHDCIELLPDGSFRIYNKQGKNLWKDFL